MICMSGWWKCVCVCGGGGGVDEKIYIAMLDGNIELAPLNNIK